MLPASRIGPLLSAALLVACTAQPPLPATVPAPVRMDAEGQVGAQAQQRPALSAEVLPSLVNTATLKVGAPLLQRPKVGSVILKSLAAGEVVQVLGELGNADGQWRSVASGEAQGWVRAADLGN